MEREFCIFQIPYYDSKNHEEHVHPLRNCWVSDFGDGLHSPWRRCVSNTEQAIS